MAGDFLDTNVLIYLLEEDTIKAARAEELIAVGAVVSVQVLSEIVATARRKRPGCWADTVAFLETVRPLLTIVPLTLDMHVMAVALIGRYGFSPCARPSSLPRCLQDARPCGPRTCRTGWWSSVS